MINRAILPEPIVQQAVNLAIEETCRELRVQKIDDEGMRIILLRTYMRLIESRR